MANIQLSTAPAWWQRHLFWVVQLPLLLLAVLVTYGHTLDVPFYLDDFSSIQENPVIYNWQGTFAELWQFSAARVVGYLTFALNYQWHYFSVTGYHVVNILIHFLAGCAVFALTRGLMRSPVLDGHLSPSMQRWIPFIVALLFLLHPLQIQAVTYIVQRLAAMAALFYIATLACFVQARLSTQSRTMWLWLAAGGGFALLAFFTKQNTATLPVAILLIEWIFFRSSLQRLALLSSVAIGVIIALVFILIWSMGQNPFSLEAMQSMTRETTEISRMAYLATQMTVLWWYISLLFVPTGMHIDYNYPIADGFLEPTVLIAFLGHAALIALALVSVRRAPILAFGLLFYYLAHAIESSVLPIRDVVFEHRTYLPNLGFFLIAGWLLLGLLPQWFNWRSAIAVTVVCSLILGGLTVWRNQVWRDPVTLWQDNLAKAPDKRRAWVILGKHLIQAGRPHEGLKALERSAELTQNPNGTTSKTYSVEALLNMVVAMRHIDQDKQALSLIDQVLKGANLRAFDRAKFLVNRGNVLYQLKQYAEAEASYRTAIQVFPQNIAARANLASALAARGSINEAITLYQEILQIDPDNQVIIDNLWKLQNR